MPKLSNLKTEKSMFESKSRLFLDSVMKISDFKFIFLGGMDACKIKKM
jgi:hypothetical protein